MTALGARRTAGILAALGLAAFPPWFHASAHPAPLQQADAEVRDLPLIEARAPRGGGTLAVFVSGDGGWAAIDKAIAGALQAQGVNVVGINSMKYFWRTQTPEGTSADLARIIRHYRQAWHTDTVVVIGYSRGAGVVPFMVNRLPADLREPVRLVALLGAEHTAGFEFHVTDLFRGGRRNDPAVMPEIDRLGGLPLLCFYGADEDDTLCPELKKPSQVVVRLGGGHHFDGNYAEIGERIGAELRKRPGPGK